ncbi:DNA helicase UvrD [Caulobacter flavus]|uniref:DNA 3'-5' helicase II n=1 Tax=Caulobacter flavus TaxID=1679497 RepID=A0ABN5QDR7_9CAUL|nr:DNA helicase UvrD [Caulobacter flavus]
MRSFEVVERAILTPSKQKDEWDAIDTVFESLSAGPVTVRSLRTALRAIGVEIGDDDYLAQLIAGDPTADNIVDGLRRAVIEKMELRQRSVLDIYQDDIFRLPLDTRLAILGPPGTGKTTTLIKRLRQKIDTNYLDEDERRQVAVSAAGVSGHADSWLMFTPNELLKRYVVEALGREGVPASDLTVQTWDDFRMDLARNRLGVLRSGTSSGAQYRPKAQNLLAATVQDQAAWFDDFHAWQAEEFWAELERHAETLATAGDARVRALGQRLRTLLPASRDEVSASALLAFGDLQRDVATLEDELKSATEQKVRVSIVPHARQDNAFLDKLHAFAKTARDAPEVIDDLDDGDDEDDEAPPPRGNREEAIAIYVNAQRRLARSIVLKRSLSPKSRDGRILEWLGQRGLPEASQKEVGEAEVQRQALRQFANPVRQYVARMRARYGRFRRDRIVQNRWYNEAVLSAGELSPLEVDLVVLAMLRAGRGMLSDRRLLASVDEPRYAIIRSIRALLRNQVVVDEATDFSPIQLACMGQLSDPAIGSFVACGDFNQRITPWGSRSEADLHWVFSDLQIRPIIVTYRHSRPLADLATKLSAMTPSAGQAAQLPDHLSNDGPRPVLAIGLDTPALAQWLTDRIAEIEHITGRFPSIAVLVNDEAEVEPVAAALDEALVERLNIRCEACVRGQSRGKDNNVRVFDVQHIKGLEFEAVFFVGIDVLAENSPDLFDKFLYVGTTRAATYLGLTTEQDVVPSALAPLIADFGQTFEDPA